MEIVFKTGKHFVNITIMSSSDIGIGSGSDSGGIYHHKKVVMLNACKVIVDLLMLMNLWVEGISMIHSHV